MLKNIDGKMIIIYTQKIIIIKKKRDENVYGNDTNTVKMLTINN